MVNVGTRVLVLLFFTLAVIIPSSVEQSRQTFKCPRRCRCFSSSGSNGWEVDCGNKNLKDLPNIPRNTVTLAIQDNELLQILPKSFTRNKKLQKLFLYRNKIVRVHSEAFQGLENLQMLSLFGNKLTEINNGTFKHLSSLKELYLYQNRIKNLNKNSFVGLSSLKLLSLRDNALTNVEKGTFSSLGQLDSLFLFGNKLTKLTVGMFDGLRSLKILLIGRNRISDIENGAFKGLSSLTELFIDNNILTQVDSRMFADLTSLKKLHLSNNAIKRIDPGSFFRLRQLSVIAASNNRISQITQGMFAGLTSLKVLHLQANRIVHISSKSFMDLASLRTLFLYQNKINVILKDALVGLVDLRQLHLGFNMISEIADGAFSELKQLTTLYLDSNKLPRIAKGTLQGLSSLLDLYVHFNRISYVANNAFSDNKVLRYISWNVPRILRTRQKYQNISGNLLFCDCHGKYLKRWLSKHPAVDVSCYEPSEMRNTPLRRLKMLDLEKCYEPSVQTEPTTVTVNTGDKVNFQCTGTPTVEYLWYKNGSRILAKGDVDVSSFGTLTLSNIKNSDEGLYVCAAKNKKSFAVATVSLSVGHKPYFRTSPDSAEVYVGSKITLHCQVAAEPPSTTTWRKNGDEVAPDEERVLLTFQGTLIILDAKLSDAGRYTCEARNKLGMIAKDVSVVVKEDTNQLSKLEHCTSPSTASPIDQDKDINVSGSDSGDDYEDDKDDDTSSADGDNERDKTTTPTISSWTSFSTFTSTTNS